MGRVSIIGNAAGGKSTLCKKLKVAKGLPLFAVDTLQWKPGLIPVPREDVASGIKEIISKVFEMIWMIHKTIRPQLLELVENFSNKIDVFHIKFPRELKRFMAKHC